MQSGNGILAFFSLTAMLLSLIPVLIILFRKAWHSELLNFLMVLCLLTFFQHLLARIPQQTASNRIFIQAVFSLSEFVILLFLLRPAGQPKWIRDLFNIFGIAFLSVVITIYTIKGATLSSGTVGILQALVLLAAAAFTVIQLLRSDQVYVFQQPVFWIIIGVVVYYSMYLLLELLQQDNGSIPDNQQQEKALLLTILHIIRSGCFIMAAYTGSSKIKPEQPIGQ